MILIDEGAPQPRPELHSLERVRNIPVSVRKVINTAHKQHHKKTGVRQCKWCAGVVKRPRLTYCSEDCVHEWKLRSSGSYVRAMLIQRDKGVCCQCGIDTKRMASHLNPRAFWTTLLREFLSRRGLTRDDLTPEVEAAWDRHRKKLMDRVENLRRRVDRSWSLAAIDSRSMWEADHIVRVVDGGGCCGIENYQTLCVYCHSRKTRKGNSKRKKVPPKKRPARRIIERARRFH